MWSKNVCRLCGEVGDICYDIFESNLELAEKVKKCLNLQISEEDFKPKKICSPCYNRLDDLSHFIDICMSTNLKFESIYYSDLYPVMANHKNVYEASVEQMVDHLDSPKQSVIVSNRQGIDRNLQSRETNKQTIVILESYGVSQPEILEFNINCDNVSPTEMTGPFFANDKFLSKADDMVGQISLQDGGKSEEQCLVLGETLPNYLLDPLENENIPKCKQSKNTTERDKYQLMSQFDRTNKLSSNNKAKLKTEKLISIDDVKKSLVSQQKCFNEVQNSDLKNNKSYPCPHCEKVFKRRINLTAHISVHTNIRSFKCTKCPKTFAIKSHLTQHKKAHSELFKCYICQKRFEVPSKLSRHMQTHDTNKPFTCGVENCNKSFSDKHNLKQHILCHNAVKNLSCNICEKLFKTKKNLRAHVKSHINENVYQCTYCEKCFKYKHNLKSHVIKHGIS